MIPEVLPLRAAILVACAWAATPAAGADAAPPHLADLTLEELSSLSVTSVGKRVQRLADVPGSVFIISQEDIRRSGATTLPEILRLAPNLHVARADAQQYAISARGFNSVLANKMLVLVDGRTVYSPLFSGVFWEATDLLGEDIERIEVLSGSGGTLYGSNAVNGVINIVTRNASETTGVLAKAGAGNRERLAGGRVGGTTRGGLHWRLSAKHFETDASRLDSGAAVRDAGHRTQASFRADQVQGRDQFTLQGDLYHGRIDQVPAERRIAGGNLLARWSRDHAPGERSQLQAFVDRTERRQPGAVDDTLDTVDLEFQQTRRPGAGHELLWGAGYRRQDDHLTNLAPALLAFRPERRRLHLWNLFAQDEFALAPGLRATLGLKAEHNGYTGLEWLPNARLAWNPGEGQLLWAAASRAVRAPARVDRDVTTPQLTLGGADFDSEIAQVFEIGWRAQPTSAVSYSLTLFHHDFTRLRSVDLRAGGIAFGNSYEGRLAGVEGWGRWRVTERLRLHAGFTHQRLRIDAAPGSTLAPGGTAQLGNDPRTRLQLGASWDLGSNLELDAQWRRVGALSQPAVPAYTALDLRLGWRVRPDLELSVAGRNLASRRHAEWGVAGARAEFDRSVFFKAVWRQ